MVVDGHPQGAIILVVEVVHEEVETLGTAIAQPAITTTLLIEEEEIHDVVRVDQTVVLGQMKRHFQTTSPLLLGTR